MPLVDFPFQGVLRELTFTLSSFKAFYLLDSTFLVVLLAVIFPK